MSSIKANAGDFTQVKNLGIGIGAHLLGYVSREFIAKENFTFSRITCLDPSGENFEKVYGFWLSQLKPVDPKCAK